MRPSCMCREESERHGFYSTQVGQVNARGTIAVVDITGRRRGSDAKGQ